MATKVKLIETGAVTGNIIPDGGIATGKLADDAVTTIKISDGNITHEKLHTSMDLTGKTVTVATAAGSTNTTAAASTAFVQQELTTLIGGAPSTLDTLNELAAAINDDASYASTLTTALATKLPLAGGTMTGALTVTGDANPALEISRGSANTTNVNLKYNTTLTGQISAANEKFQISAAGSGTEMEFYVNGAKRLEIDTSGNVGIGNSSPSSLSWPNGSTGGLFLQAGGLLSAYNAGTNLSQNWYYNSGEKFIGNGGASRYVQAGQEHVFSRSTTVNASGAAAALTWSESLRIDENGNVGIGTDSPGAKLEISKETTWGTLNNHIISIQNSGTGGDINALHDMGSIVWKSGSIDTAAISAIRNTPGAGNNVDLRFTTATQSSGQQTSMTILSGGNVGIGTDGPTTKLHVSTTGEVYVATIENLGVAGNKHGLWIKSDSTWSSSNLLKVTKGTSDVDTFIVNPDRVYIEPNVGIGQTAPGANLHIGGQEAASPTAGTVDRLHIQPYSNTGGPYKFKARTVSGSSDFLDMYYGSNHIISYGLDAKVGIGTTVPNAPLTVWTASSATSQSALRLNNPGGFASSGAGCEIIFSQDRSTSEDYRMAAISSGQQYSGSSAGGDLKFWTRGSSSITNKMTLGAGGDLTVDGPVSIKDNSLTIDSDYGHWSGRYQTLVCHNAITASNSQVWTDVAFVSYSPSLTIQGTAQRDNNGSYGMASYFGTIFGGYGNVNVYATTNIANPMNSGGFGQLEYRYLNGGAASGAYRLQVRQQITSGTMYITTTLNGQAFNQITED